MSTRDRILDALKLGAMTADQLKVRLSLSEGTIRSHLHRLREECLVRSTRAGSAGLVGAAPRVYSLAGGLIELGAVSEANARVTAKQVGEILHENGEVALFIGSNRQAALALHFDRDYEGALERHSESLVGRYRTKENTRFSSRAVVADILHRLSELAPAERAHAV